MAFMDAVTVRAGAGDARLFAGNVGKIDAVPDWGIRLKSLLSRLTRQFDLLPTNPR